MYRSSPFRSTLNTGYITCLGMCKVCTEAVHSVALWTCVPMQGTLSSPPPQPTPHHPSCVAFDMCGKNMPIPRGRKYVVSKNKYAYFIYIFHIHDYTCFFLRPKKAKSIVLAAIHLTQLTGGHEVETKRMAPRAGDREAGWCRRLLQRDGWDF